jgi:hypothetical protein
MSATLYLILALVAAFAAGVCVMAIAVRRARKKPEGKTAKAVAMLVDGGGGGGPQERP